jgi:hypothetical protein
VATTGIDDRSGQNPRGEAGATGQCPSVTVTDTQPSAGSAVVAASHHASARLGSPPHWRARIGEELGTIWLAASPPPAAVPGAQDTLMHWAIAALDLAELVAKDWVVGVGDEDVDAELRPNSGQQHLQQASPVGGPRGGVCYYNRTSRLVNHPAASRVLRASSTVRCPYVSSVVVIEAWPRSSFTDSMPAPRRSSQVA